jgi:hypothetical protein
MSVNNLYYEKYLKYKNKYLNLQSQIGGYFPVFISIIDAVGQTSVVPARKYQAYAYNKYFAIKQQSNPMNQPLPDKYEGMDITYTIRFDKVEFVIREDGNDYIFEIKDFKDGDESFCILVNARKQEQVLSNNESLLKFYVEQARIQKQEAREARVRAAQVDAPVFVAYQRGNMLAVDPARDYQEIAYKIYMKLVRGEYLENELTINDMEITVFGVPPQVQFSIQKSSERFPYKFIIKKYIDDKKPSFVSLVKEDKTENILSNDEKVLRGWAGFINRVTDM